MSEYWVSKKKYFCKYCDIYIADDAPSRTQHETGLRHKGNRDRFIRSLYKDGEKRKKDLEEEKREMARVELAAQAAFAQDVSAGHAKATAPIASSSSTAPKPPPKPSNPFSNYSTAASLGFTDPDAERLAAEAESRRTQGVAGNWEYVEAPTAQSKETDSLKREAETPAEEWDTREFKLRKKTLGTGLGQIYDPGIISVKLKAKDEPVGDSKDNIIMTASSNANSNPPNATDAPKWTKTQWKRPGERVKEEAGTGSEQLIKQEEAAQAGKGLDGTATMMADGQPGDQAVKPEPGSTDTVKVETTESAPPAPAPGGGMFRKRKAPAGGARGRRDI